MFYPVFGNRNFNFSVNSPEAQSNRPLISKPLAEIAAFMSNYSALMEDNKEVLFKKFIFPYNTQNPESDLAF